MMVHYLKRLTVKLTVGLLVFWFAVYATVAANGVWAHNPPGQDDPPYRYLINGYEYRIDGESWRISYNSYIFGRTWRWLPQGSPDINFQILKLRQRLWRIDVGCPALLIGAVFGGTTGGDCDNCKDTGEYDNFLIPPPEDGDPSDDWTAVGRHKLQDTRATNYYTGEPPAWFYSEYRSHATPSHAARWKGKNLVPNCNLPGYIPAAYEDPNEEPDPNED